MIGCPATLDGSPIGGGLGYLNTIDPSQADYVVDTADELKSALAKAASGQIVYVADGATIMIAGSSDIYSDAYGIGFYVKPGVTLAGGRGRAGVIPGKLTVNTVFLPSGAGKYGCRIVKLDTGSRLCGLTIVGVGPNTDSTNPWFGVQSGTSSQIDNNEIHSFAYCGVQIYQQLNGWVHHNYIHHCQAAGYGYPVYISSQDTSHPASMLVEGNLMDYARHFIAASQGRSSYTFRYNHLGAHCTNTQIDCHGNNDNGGELDKDANGEYMYCAGENLDIYNNTSECLSNPLVKIRGTPYSKGFVHVHHNWTYLPATWRGTYNHGDGTSSTIGPIGQNMHYVPPYYRYAPNEGAYVFMEDHDNWYGSKPPPSNKKTANVKVRTTWCASK